MSDGDNIVSFEKVKVERSPHHSGEFQCLNCKHKWIGVSPTGTVFVECPKCEAQRGVPTGPMMDFDHPVFHCTACNATYFFITFDTKNNMKAAIFCGCCAAETPIENFYEQ